MVEPPENPSGDKIPVLPRNERPETYIDAVDAYVDRGIAPLIKLLNEYGVTTLYSCSGLIKTHYPDGANNPENLYRSQLPYISTDAAFHPDHPAAFRKFAAATLDAGWELILEVPQDDFPDAIDISKYKMNQYWVPATTLTEREYTSVAHSHWLPYHKNAHIKAYETNRYILLVSDELEAAHETHDDAAHAAIDGLHDAYKQVFPQCVASDSNR